MAPSTWNSDPRVGDTNSATDGDLDAAYALLLAGSHPCAGHNAGVLYLGLSLLHVHEFSCQFQATPTTFSAWAACSWLCRHCNVGCQSSLLCVAADGG